MEPILEATRLSVWVAGAGTLLTVPLGLLTATLLHRSRWRFLEAVFLLPLFLPPTVSGFFILWILSPLHPLGRVIESMGGDIVFTRVGTALACAVVSFPLAFQACMIGLSRVHPELVESARVLGGTPWFNTFRVLWPQMKGAVLVAGLLVFARTLGEFGASMMVGGNIPGVSQTLPLAVYSLSESGKYGQAGVASLISVLLGLTLYALLRALERKTGVR